MAGTFATRCRKMGWCLARGDAARPTHLLLSGGRLLVPDDMHALFLNEYASSVAREGYPPGVVELRTPVFRMFLDLDFGSSERWDPDPDEDADFFGRLRQAAAEVWPGEASAEMIACRARDGDADPKRGYHVYWPGVWTTAATATAFRDGVVEMLEALLPGRYATPWPVVVDACVFKGNGLRLPFCRKKGGEARVYLPWRRWAPEEPDGGVVLEPGDRPSVVRAWLARLGVRSRTGSQQETPCSMQVAAAAEAADERRAAPRESLAGLAEPLAALEACLGPDHAGQRFTDLTRLGAECVSLRSSSRFCANLGRRHKNNTVYFVLTRAGLSQRCFCKCDTTEGREFGYCRDFKGPPLAVPTAAADALLRPPATQDPATQAPATQARPPPSQPQPQARQVTSRLPSKTRTGSMSLSDLLTVTKRVRR